MQMHPFSLEDAKLANNYLNGLLQSLQCCGTFEAKRCAMPSSLVSQESEPRKPLAQRYLGWHLSNIYLESFERLMKQPDRFMLPVTSNSTLSQFSLEWLQITSHELCSRAGIRTGGLSPALL